jgi:VanZ family protein
MMAGERASGSGTSTDSMPARKQAAIAFLLWTVFVVYGSLLPFDFTPRPFAEALATFAAIPTYAIGPGGRADWVANLVLYIPLPFLALWMLDSESRANRVLASVIVVLALAGLAVAVEFLQIFFPPRTVSANDLAAEGLGIALGTVAWFALRRNVLTLAARYSQSGPAALGVLAIVYVVAYVLLALFPFDFVLSAPEFAQKIASDLAGWWMAPVGCTHFLPCTLQLFADALFAVPLGIAVVAWRGRVPALATLAAWGLLLGGAIELAQLTLVSGVAQGVSVLAKAAGFVAGGLLAPCGLVLWQRLRRWRHLPTTIGLAAVAYAIVLSILLEFWNAAPMSWNEARARLPDVFWLPLYYYYFTSESRALTSLIVQALLYAPIGALLALGAPTLRPAAAMKIAALTAGTTAVMAQAVRLFHPPQRPDVTDVLIAMLAAIAGYRLTLMLVRMLDGDAPMKAPEPESPGLKHSVGSTHSPVMTDAMRTTSTPAPTVATAASLATPVSTASPVGHPSLPLRILAGLLGALVIWSLVHYPLSRTALAAILAAYAAAIIRWPAAWYVVLPAALPVADLAGWSGRLYFSEFDRLVLVTLAVACWRAVPDRAVREQRHFPALLLIFVALPVAISVIRGLLPLDPFDANAFTTYVGHYNALRIGKGLLWAVLLCRLAQREGLPQGERSRLFGYGLALGSAMVIAVVVWERFVFTGLANFAHEYRVTGPFWEMNTGGAYIEGFLVSTLPFVVYLLVSERSVLAKIWALGAFAAGTYAVMVTMSRNGVAGLAVALAVLCAGIVVHYGRKRRGGVKGLIGTVVLLSLAGLVAIPILTGATLKGRFANTREDFNVRLNHWALALDLRGNDAANKWLGMGLGRFPEAYFWGSGNAARPGSYRFMDDGSQRFLRLGAGESLYFEQFVAIDPGTRYTISFAVRTNLPHASFTVPVCEKWLLESFECAWQSIELSGPSSTFRRHMITIDSGAMSRGIWFKRRPVRLALHNPNNEGTIDVADVQLIGPDGRNLIANGDFADGMDHWHFSVDSHLSWHTKNLAVQILFDQGWLGLAAWAALIAFAFARGAAGLWRGDLFAAATLAGLTGFLVVGVFDSMIDSPRLLLLLGLLLWLAATPRTAEGVAVA